MLEGKWKCYTGAIYDVQGIGEHWHMEQKFVIMKDKTGTTFLLPEEEFYYPVHVDKVKLKRFERV